MPQEGADMAIYRIMHEWTNYRITEIEADTADEALEAVENMDGNEVDGGTDNHYTSILVMDEKSGYFEEVTA
jgi:hypothetical protein